MLRPISRPNATQEPFEVAGSFFMTIPHELRRYAGLKTIEWQIQNFEFLRTIYTQNGVWTAVIQMRNKHIDLEADVHGFGLMSQYEIRGPREPKVDEEFVRQYESRLIQVLMIEWTKTWAREYIKDWPEE